MKKMFALTLVILSVSLSAVAKLPDPNTCGKELGIVEINHSGGFLTWGTYSTKINFTRPGEFLWKSNLGLDLIYEDVNANLLKNEYKYHFKSAQKLNCAQNSADCALSLYHSLDSLQGIISRSHARGSELAREQKALLCAKSIAFGMAQRSLIAELNLTPKPLHQLSDEEVVQVAQRMEMLEQTQEAQAAASAAQTQAIMAQSQAITSQMQSVSSAASR